MNSLRDQVVKSVGDLLPELPDVLLTNVSAVQELAIPLLVRGLDIRTVAEKELDEIRGTK